MITCFEGPHEFLSNFWPSPLLWQGVAYPTLEHAFQAAKTLDEDKRRWIAELPYPADAKAVGQRLPLRPDWEEAKAAIMADLVALKFADPDLRARLLATGTAEIVEGNHWFDRVWGQCPLGVGENRLGLILMAERERIRATATVRK
ncbi:MAG: NADAR family protein [Rhodospirillaceae bacterium]